MGRSNLPHETKFSGADGATVVVDSHVQRIVVVFFTLTDRASIIPWLPIRYVVCWTEKDQRNIYQGT